MPCGIQSVVRLFGLPAAPRLRASELDLIAEHAPPTRLEAGRANRRLSAKVKLTRQGCDELCAISDIYLQNPNIRVLLLTTVEVFVNFI